jgi:hypothetical protein
VNCGVPLASPVQWSDRLHVVIVVTRSVSFEVARFSREAAAARSCERKPAESEAKIVASREAAAAIGREEISAAASRLGLLFCLVPVGLRPRLHAAIASRFRNGATLKLTLRVTIIRANEGRINYLAMFSGYAPRMKAEKTPFRGAKGDNGCASIPARRRVCFWRRGGRPSARWWVPSDSGSG